VNNCRNSHKYSDT